MVCNCMKDPGGKFLPQLLVLNKDPHDGSMSIPLLSPVPLKLSSPSTLNLHSQEKWCHHIYILHSCQLCFNKEHLHIFSSFWATAFHGYPDKPTGQNLQYCNGNPFLNYPSRMCTSTPPIARLVSLHPRTAIDYRTFAPSTDDQCPFITSSCTQC